MPKISINIDDKAYSRIRSAMIVRQMSGMAYGPLDDFLGKIFNALEAGKTEIEISPAKRYEEGKPTP